MNITKNVMERVVFYEQKRVSGWVRWTVAFLGLFSVLFFAVSFVTIQKINDYGSWDLLSLFWEDPEIISRFWQDTLATFWLEVPKNEFWFLIIIIFLFILWYKKSRKNRIIMKKRMQTLAKYKK